MHSKYYKFVLDQQKTINIDCSCAASFFLKLRTWDGDILLETKQGTDTLLNINKQLPKGDYKIEVGTSVVNPAVEGIGPMRWIDNVDANITNEGKTIQRIYHSGWVHLETDLVLTKPSYFEIDLGYCSGGVRGLFGLVWGEQTLPLNTFVGTYANACGWYDVATSEYYYYNTGSASHNYSIYNDNTLRIAIDPTTGKIWFGRDAIWNGTEPTSPASVGHIQVSTNSEPYCRFFYSYSATSTIYYFPMTVVDSPDPANVPSGFFAGLDIPSGLPPSDPYELRYEVLP